MKFAGNINARIGKDLTLTDSKKFKKKYKLFGTILIICAVALITLAIINLVHSISSNKVTCPSMGEEGWLDCETTKSEKLFSKIAGAIIILFFSIIGTIVLLISGIGIIINANSIITTDGELALYNEKKIVKENKIYNRMSASDKICSSCGAKMVYKNGTLYCKYCGNKM